MSIVRCLKNQVLSAVVLSFVVSGLVAADAASNELWQLRNLGKAFYENPTTQLQAVDVFKKALDLAPDSPRERLNYGLALLRAGKTDQGIAELKAVQAEAPQMPHTWFNLGIVYKKQANYAEALKQFEQMVKLVPDEPISHYNLGVVLKLTGQVDRASGEFQRSAELDPNLAGPLFQLYNSLRAEGKTEEADRMFQRFQENKKKQAGAAIPEDLDWSYYAEILDDVDPVEAGGPSPAEFSANLGFEKTELGSSSLGPVLGLFPADQDGDGAVDLLGWTEKGLFVFRKVSGAAVALHDFGAEKVRGVLPSDFNNDGIVDYAVVLDSRVSLMKGAADGLAEVLSFADSPASSGLWVDFDHDGDPDLFLFGGKPVLLRNNGGAGFAPASEQFPFVDGTTVCGASFELVKDTNATDLLVLYKGRPAVLYRDRLAGLFEAVEQPGLPSDGEWLGAEDVDNDGWIDLAVRSGGVLRFVLNRGGKLEVGASEIPVKAEAVLADLGNRGFLDVVADDHVLQGLGVARWGAPVKVEALAGTVAAVPYDVDADGKVDLAAADAEGHVAVLYNRYKGTSNWLGLTLAGSRNPRLAAGTEVEVKAGSLYQKRVYEGTPLVFGLGSHAKVETVRITWPNGLIQNEAEQAVGQKALYKEKQRLSGSCPMVFAWNGKDFGFITDVLAVAPLGAAAGDGVFFQVDHDEYVQIDGSSLARNSDGFYEIRVTEELREVGYLDQMKLIAVDHPKDQAVFTSEKFKAPPFPDFRLYGIQNRVYPQAAVDQRGKDVRELILRRDRRYPDGFKRDFLGVAEDHFIELDFGREAVPAQRAVLVLNGWVDWADGSTIRKIAQDSSTALRMPSLQVLNARGEWETVVADMGVPAGKPKTIVVDLSGLFPTAERKVRINTNLCVYWDEIFLSRDAAQPKFQVHELDLADANLDYRGFSTPVIHAQRLQPEEFIYADWTPSSMWNQASGLYTRYGDVSPLLGKIDDQFVIMGSGDELRVRFSDRSLPPVPPGQVRDYLLFVDGWAKDGDLNTAYSDSVEPLPFHGMSAYPYPGDEHYPDSDAHKRYRATYNTRPALRTIRSLAESERTLPTGSVTVPSEGKADK